jgi:hypothetical protein
MSLRLKCKVCGSALSFRDEQGNSPSHSAWHNTAHAAFLPPHPPPGFLLCTTCFTQSQDFVPDEQEAQQVLPAAAFHRPPAHALPSRKEATRAPKSSGFTMEEHRQETQAPPLPTAHCVIVTFQSGLPDSTAPLAFDVYVHGWCCLLQVTARRRPAVFRLNAAAGLQMVATAADAELKMGRYHRGHRPACRTRWRAYRSGSLVQGSCYHHAQALVSRLSAKVAPAARPRPLLCAYSPLPPVSGGGIAQLVAGVHHPASSATPSNYRHHRPSLLPSFLSPNGRPHCLFNTFSTSWCRLLPPAASSPLPPPPPCRLLPPAASSPLPPPPPCRLLPPAASFPLPPPPPSSYA